MAARADRSQPDVLLVSPGYPPALGGVEHHVSRLADGLTRSGWRVEVATNAAPGDGDGEDWQGGVLVHRFALTLGHPAYRWSAGLQRWVEQHGRRYKIVHAHSYHALPALAASRVRDAKVVFTPHFHGTGHTPVAKLLHIAYRPIGATIFRRADAIVCVAEAEAELVRRRFPKLTAELRVIPNGIDRPELRIPSAAPTERRRVILFSGRLEPYKNVDRLIRAAADLGPGYVLVVTGEGPEMPRLKTIAGESGAGDRIRFAGFVSREELEGWQRAAIVYVSMSDHEAFDLGAREAAVHGARVIASDIPAHREMLRDLTPGAVTLVAARIQPAALARVIDSTAALGRVSPVGGGPDWREVVRDMIDLYEGVTGYRQAA